MKNLMILMFVFYSSSLLSQNYSSLDSVNTEISETYEFINKYSKQLYVLYVYKYYLSGNPYYVRDKHADLVELEDDRMIFNIDMVENDDDGSYSKLDGWITCDLSKLKSASYSDYTDELRLDFVSPAVNITGTWKDKAFSTWPEEVTDLSRKDSFLEISIDDGEMRSRMLKAFRHLADMHTKRRALLQKASGDKF